jgi:hypothetical protein
MKNYDKLLKPIDEFWIEVPDYQNHRLIAGFTHVPYQSLSRQKQASNAVLKILISNIIIKNKVHPHVFFVCSFCLLYPVKPVPY